MTLLVVYALVATVAVGLVVVRRLHRGVLDEMRREAQTQWLAEYGPLPLHDAVTGHRLHWRFSYALHFDTRTGTPVTAEVVKVWYPVHDGHLRVYKPRTKQIISEYGPSALN